MKEDEPMPTDLNVPWWFRALVATFALALIVPALCLIWSYVHDPRGFASPSDVGAVQLIVGGIVLLLIAVAPWKALGLRIRKVGFVEFERVVNTQAQEHIEDFGELRTRIEEVENKVRGIDEIAPISEHFEERQLYPLLAQFLRDFGSKPYSPLKIRTWGARQPSYEKLANFTQGAIRRVLQKLVTEGKAVTSVSRMGNTLYKSSS